MHIVSAVRGANFNPDPSASGPTVFVSGYVSFNDLYVYFSRGISLTSFHEDVIVYRNGSSVIDIVSYEYQSGAINCIYYELAENVIQGDVIELENGSFGIIDINGNAIGPNTYLITNNSE